MVSKIKESGIVAIIRGIHQDDLAELAQAIAQAGVQLIEYTFNQSAEDPSEELKQNLSIMLKVVPDGVTIGAGTVLTAEQVQAAYEGGAKFIVTPNTNPEVIRAARERNMGTLIGAMTPTEVEKAASCGADAVKIFPAEALGASYIKAIRAPLSHIPMLAVGGIRLEFIENYMRAGVIGFGIGGSLFDPEIIKRRDFASITRNVRQYVDAVKKARE